MSLYLEVGSNKTRPSSETPERDLKYWLWLHELKSLRMQKKRELLATHGDPKTIYHLSPQELGLPSKEGAERPARSFDAERSKQLVRASRILQENIFLDMEILTYDDYRYQKVVRNDLFAPLVLFYRGTLPEPIRPVVQMVADAVDQRRAIEQLPKACGYYRERGFVIATALSFGSGTRLLEQILEHSDTVFAGCSGGLDRCYPLESYHLFERIVDNGAIISAHPMGVVPTAYRAIGRNRLISYWCDETVVLGSPKSAVVQSSLRYAIEAGKPVYQAGDLKQMDFYAGVAETPVTCSSAPIGSDAAAMSSIIYDLLRFAALATEEVADALKVHETIALRILIDMELCGSIETGKRGRWQCRHSL